MMNSRRRDFSLRVQITALSVLALFVSTAGAAPEAQRAGEVLYREGMLPSGAQLRGERGVGVDVWGAAAACANCHRRSGMGNSEGNIVAPPITGKYLFHLNDRESFGSTSEAPHKPHNDKTYTDVALARAIREGTGADGRVLDYLMPRYDLDDKTMSLLIDYLKHLSSGPMRGVSSDTLDFATIITPDADPTQKAGMLDVLIHYFDSKNAFYLGYAPPIHTSRRIKFRVERRWQLHVWELTGAPETWEQQLEARLRAEPVFAVISGLAGKTWSPIHRFCEREALPCLLPNVDLPVTAERDFYPVYFSQGVLLEAGLIARDIEKHQSARGARIVQIFRENDIGADAANSVRTSLAQKGGEIVNRSLGARSKAKGLADALKDVHDPDTLILWLRPEDLRELPRKFRQAPRVFVSGLMGGLENAPITGPWRDLARMTYPLSLPQLRAVNMNYPLGWFTIHHIPVVAERTQTDTFIACGILAEAQMEMLDNFVPEYLVERLEDMLSTRLVNGYYPRLGLAPGQRFASKGGYLVHFADASGARLVADGDWFVP